MSIICSHCKKIKKIPGVSPAEVDEKTHGICPKCAFIFFEDSFSIDDLKEELKKEFQAGISWEGGEEVLNKMLYNKEELSIMIFRDNLYKKVYSRLKDKQEGQEGKRKL